MDDPIDVGDPVKKVGVIQREYKESNLNKRAISQTSLHKLKVKSRGMSTPMIKDFDHPSCYIYNQDPMTLNSQKVKIKKKQRKLLDPMKSS